MTRQIRNFRLDESIKEGIEYLESFWALIPKYQRMTELEYEFERGIILQQRTQFIRRVKDNDKPGKRHMLPFVWVKQRGIDGQVTEIQIRLTQNHPRYERELDKFFDRLSEVRRAYGKL